MSVSAQLQLKVECLNYNNKDGIITMDILSEQNQDVKNEDQYWALGFLEGCDGRW